MKIESIIDISKIREMKEMANGVKFCLVIFNNMDVYFLFM